MISDGTNVTVVYIDGNGWVARINGFVQRGFVGADSEVIYKVWVRIGGGQDCYAKASRVFTDDDKSVKAAVALCDRLDDGLCNQDDRDAVVFHRAG